MKLDCGERSQVAKTLAWHRVFSKVARGTGHLVRERLSVRVGNRITDNGVREARDGACRRVWLKL